MLEIREKLLQGEQLTLTEFVDWQQYQIDILENIYGLLVVKGDTLTGLELEENNMRIWQQLNHIHAQKQLLATNKADYERQSNIYEAAKLDMETNSEETVTRANKKLALKPDVSLRECVIQFNKSEGMQKVRAYQNLVKAME